LTWGNNAFMAAVVEAGAIHPLVELLSSGSDKARAKATGALGNLTGSNAANKATIVAAGVIPKLVELLGSGSDESKENAAAVLFHLACSNNAVNNAIVAAIAEAGGIPCWWRCCAVAHGCYTILWVTSTIVLPTFYFKWMDARCCNAPLYLPTFNLQPKRMLASLFLSPVSC